MQYNEYARIIAAMREQVKPYPSDEWRAFWQKNIELAQQVTTYEIEGVSYPRFRWGEEPDWDLPRPLSRCHDCAVEVGQLHVPSCDVERCPKCYGQAFTCGCKYDEDEDEDDEWWDDDEDDEDEEEMIKKDNDLTLDEKQQLFQVKIRKNVGEHGCFIVNVFGSDDYPEWAYSIGIPTTVPGASELMLFGLNPNTMAKIINNVLYLMREKGQTFEAGKTYTDIIEGLSLYIGQVEKQYYDDLFGQAQMYHHGDNFSMLQLVWPDTQGRFPWQEGFEERFRDKQILLFSLDEELDEEQ